MWIFCESNHRKLGNSKSLKVIMKTAPEAYKVNLSCMGLPQHVFIKYGGKYWDAESPDGVDKISKLPFYQRFSQDVPLWKKQAKEISEKLKKEGKPIPKPISKEEREWVRRMRCEFVKKKRN